MSVDVEKLMPQARQAWAGGHRTKNALRKSLGVAWDRASEVYLRLSAEEQAERDRKHRDRRTTVTRLRAGKRSGRTVLARRGVLPTAPVSPGVGPVDPWDYAAPSSAPVEPPAMPTPPAPKPSVVLPAQAKRVKAWPLLLLALPAFVAIWSGWVGLGGMTGFGIVHPLPGIADEVKLNTAITLPIGLETYGTYALYVWLSGSVPKTARRFAMWSAIGSLALGAAGQVAYHLLAAAGVTAAPWQITTVVACLPVAVLGMGAALYHLVHTDEKEN